MASTITELPQNEETELALQRFSDAALAEAKQAIRAVMSSVDEFFENWQRLCEAGWAGRAAEVHAMRGRLHERFENEMRFVARAVKIATIAETASGRVPPEKASLIEAQQKLDRFRAEIFDPWQSLEDLWDMLAQSFPLSTEAIEAAYKRHGPPPAAWYDEDSKPF